MDCGAWTNGNTKPPIVIRIKGCEFGLSGAELSELCACLTAVRDGAREALSEDYLDLRTMRKNEAKGVSLIAKLGLTKPKATVERRL